jgi:hypothetical protein
MMRKFCLSLAALVCLASAGWGAQDAASAPKIEDGGTPWTAIIYSIVALAGIAVVGFKNAKRTHLD